MSDPIVIVSAARTPIGGLLGDFANLAAWELGGVAIRASVERSGVPAERIGEVLMGNCLMAGQGQAPARQAMRHAGLPDATGAVTEFTVVANTSNAAFAKFCEQFVRETKFEKPPAVALEDGQIEIPFTFTIL